MPNRIAIVGSRNHPRLDMVREYVRTLPEGTTVVSGGAPGVDVTATTEARACGFGTLEYAVAPDGTIWVVKTDPGGEPRLVTRIALPDEVSRRDRLIFRNTWIVVVSARVVAFPDGSRGGTQDAIRQAKRFRRPLETRWVDGRVENG